MGPRAPFRMTLHLAHSALPFMWGGGGTLLLCAEVACTCMLPLHASGGPPGFGTLGRLPLWHTHRGGGGGASAWPLVHASAFIAQTQEEGGALPQVVVHPLLPYTWPPVHALAPAHKWGAQRVKGAPARPLVYVSPLRVNQGGGRHTASGVAHVALRSCIVFKERERKRKRGGDPLSIPAGFVRTTPIRIGRGAGVGAVQQWGGEGCPLANGVRRDMSPHVANKARGKGGAKGEGAQGRWLRWHGWGHKGGDRLEAQEEVGQEEARGGGTRGGVFVKHKNLKKSEYESEWRKNGQSGPDRKPLTCNRHANLMGRSSQLRRMISSPAPSVSASSLAQQEHEFWKVVEPGTLISTLLSSAHQPLMVAPGCTWGTDTPLQIAGCEEGCDQVTWQQVGCRVSQRRAALHMKCRGRKCMMRTPAAAVMVMVMTMQAASHNLPVSYNDVLPHAASPDTAAEQVQHATPTTTTTTLPAPAPE
ncbi:hypothetical protein EDB83DRAFT_2646536 [Lactarius deliciosus]|nr:hypothetical protein EDB83DRAFT_2646536 [Lactarius deliciosus]